ncbi:hypothetical protein ACIRG5_06985 [Lentzea sp. NPDC102401]|uniref:hypothetical protein n=1 Tax=Lentzea sp. NPDC102401 TaxID=3364128 RepID=UPI00381A7BF4
MLDVEDRLPGPAVNTRLSGASNRSSPTKIARRFSWSSRTCSMTSAVRALLIQRRCSDTRVNSSTWPRQTLGNFSAPGRTTVGMNTSGALTLRTSMP